MSLLKKTFIILFISLGILSPLFAFTANKADDPYGLIGAGTESGLKKLAISDKTPAQFAGEIVGVGLSLIGIIFFLLMLYAGVRWMLAAGQTESVQKAKDTLEAAAIGLVIVLSAYAITQFVFNNLGVGGGDGGNVGVGSPTPAVQNACTTKTNVDACNNDANCSWTALAVSATSKCLQLETGTGACAVLTTKTQCDDVEACVWGECALK